MDRDISWENVKRVRYQFLTNYTESSCKYLIPNEDIEQNVMLFINLVNASSSHLQNNLTKDVINNGAKMFLYLNTCPNVAKAKNIYNFFLQVFKKYVYEPTNSGIILYTLNAMKLFSNDGRIISARVLEKISNLFDMSLFQSKQGKLKKETRVVQPERRRYGMTRQHL